MLEAGLEPPFGRHPRPQVLILDLDGVLRHWDPAIIAEAEAKAALPPRALASAVFDDHALLLEAVTGAITDDQWRMAIANRLTRSFGPSAAVAVESWSHPAGHVDDDVLALVRRVRSTVPVALFSNATSRLGRDLETLGLVPELDVVINSSDLGLAKPDPAAFVAAADLCGRSPRECLFVDDSTANVAGARATGMAAYQYRSAADLEALLTAVGLV